MNEKKIVYYAGRSEKRAACLSQIPDVQVQSVGGGDEANTACVLSIALRKIAHAFPIVMQDGGGSNGDAGNVVVSSDARTEIKIVDKENGVVYCSKGKPRDNAEVLRNFCGMSKVSSPGYRLRVASAVKTGAERIHVEQNACLVNLTRLGAAYLATDAGFDAYERAYFDFYCTPPYSSHGLKAMGVEEISSGISLPVLLSMGIIESLGVDTEPTVNLDAETLKLAIYTVAIGFGFQVLKEIHPQAPAAIMEWSWLNQVVRKVG